MTAFQWESLSNQGVATAAVLYFVALLAHLVEWSSLRHVAGEPAAAVPAGSRESVGSVTPGAVAVATGGSAATTGSDGAGRRTALFARLGLILTIVGAVAHAVGMLGRGMAADPNRVPWGNMYEFTLSGTFVVVLLYLVLRKRFGLAWMAPIVVAFVLALQMVAVLWLYNPVAPLSEALESYWLVIHVVAAILATGAFTLGGITSAMFLVKSRHPGGTGPMSRVPAPAVLDRVSYRIHAFGFPVWTFAVLITGPIWAHQAWSSYWNWDPKEVWAFITWVVYAAYLHARSTAGWKGRNAAILAVVGVATLWFNFIGINYFSTTSQHSYANGLSAPGAHAPRVAGG